MNTQTTDDLAAFHAFLGEKLKNGGPRPSPEEALDEWRQDHPDPEIDEEEVAAIQEAIDDMEAGDRGVPFDEAMAELLAKYAPPSQ
jgi:hypothetical protein